MRIREKSKDEETCVLRSLSVNFYQILLRYKKLRRMGRAEHVAFTQNYVRKPKGDLLVGRRML